MKYNWLFLIATFLSWSPISSAQSVLKIHLEDKLSGKFMIDYAFESQKMHSLELEPTQQVLQFELRDIGDHRLWVQEKSVVVLYGGGPIAILDDLSAKTNWRLLKESNNGLYDYTSLSDSAIPIPDISADSLVDYVNDRGVRWTKIASECKSFYDLACEVVVLSMFVKIEQNISGQWLDRGQIKIDFPIGC